MRLSVFRDFQTAASFSNDENKKQAPVKSSAQAFWQGRYSDLCLKIYLRGSLSFPARRNPSPRGRPIERFIAGTASTASPHRLNLPIDVRLDRLAELGIEIKGGIDLQYFLQTFQDALAARQAIFSFFGDGPHDAQLARLRWA